MREAKIVRRDGGTDSVIAYTYEEFPYQICKRMKQKTQSKKKANYFTQFATFDIESTTIETDGYKQWLKHDKEYDLPKEQWPYAFMYHWQMCVGGVVCYGRTWSEWIEFMTRLKEVYENDHDNLFVIYVHNLGYEFQFMRDFLSRDFGGYEIFANAKRKPIYVKTSNGFEFRCSYKLSNMSLEMYTLNEKDCLHIKAAGDLDYKKLRTPSTYLNDEEFGYCVSDVVGLYEAIQSHMKHEHDTIVSVPLTSTGFPRRDCRRACRKDEKYRDEYFYKTRLDKTAYTLLKEAGRGGNTHTNRFMSGSIWENGYSFDEISGYPAMQLLKPEFPISKFTAYGEIESRAELEKMCKKYACLFRVAFKNLKIKEGIPMPYLPIDKALDYSKKEYKADNGRFLSAGAASFTLTNIDWDIVKLQYKWDEFIVSDFHFAKKGYLPKALRKTIKQYFYEKCELKLKIRKLKKEKPADWETLLENAEYLYGKSKNRLNGIFGMTYSDIIRSTVSIDEETGEWKETSPEDIEHELNKYYKSRNNFLNYAWGVWTTALNRKHLETLLQATGGYGIGKGHSGQVIYCDTDSSKCIEPDFELIEQLNQKIIEENIKADAFVELEGERFYLGLYDLETEVPYKKFKALGAKKYAYEDEDGLHITISGVNKKLGAKEMQSIENFVPGFLFKEAGGVTLYYNDKKIHHININGEDIETASNIGMVDSTYRLNITEDYADLIHVARYEPKKRRKRKRDVCINETKRTEV